MNLDKLFTKEDILDMLDGFSYDIEQFRNELEFGTLIEEDNDPEVKFIQTATLDEWKTKVLAVLPNGTSMKMRMDIEKFLDSIKNIY